MVFSRGSFDPSEDDASVPALSTRANWFIDLGGVDEATEDSLGPPRIMDIGMKIDLHELDSTRRLVELLQAESELFDAGTRCPIKDDPQTTCSACSVRCTDALDALTPLCRIGVAQERAVTNAVIARLM